MIDQEECDPPEEGKERLEKCKACNPDYHMEEQSHVCTRTLMHRTQTAVIIGEGFMWLVLKNNFVTHTYIHPQY